MIQQKSLAFQPKITQFLGVPFHTSLQSESCYSQANEMLTVVFVPCPSKISASSPCHSVKMSHQSISILRSLNVKSLLFLLRQGSSLWSVTYSQSQCSISHCWQHCCSCEFQVSLLPTFQISNQFYWYAVQLTNITNNIGYQVHVACLKKQPVVLKLP